MSARNDDELKEPTLHDGPLQTWPEDTTQIVYIPLAWEQHFNVLHHILQNQNVLLAIVGVHGVGKTLFMQHLLHQIDETMHTYTIHADALQTPQQLIDILTTQFGLPPHHSEILEEQLDSQIAAIQYHEKPCVLAIDAAENLPEDVLHALIYLIQQQSNSQMQLHIMLFGQPKLQIKIARLAKNELSSDIIHCVELEPFNSDETEQYIRHCLAAADIGDPMPFSTIALERIYHQSNGVPEAINQYAAKYLGETTIMESSETTSVSFWQANQAKIIGGSVLVAALLLMTVMLDRNGKSTTTTVKKSASSVMTFSNQNPQSQQPIPDAKLAVNSTTINVAPSATQQATPATSAPTAIASTDNKQPPATNQATPISPNMTNNTANNSEAGPATPFTPANSQNVPLPPPQEYKTANVDATPNDTTSTAPTTAPVATSNIASPTTPSVTATPSTPESSATPAAAVTPSTPEPSTTSPVAVTPSAPQASATPSAAVTPSAPESSTTSPAAVIPSTAKPPSTSPAAATAPTTVTVSNNESSTQPATDAGFNADAAISKPATPAAPVNYDKLATVSAPKQATTETSTSEKTAKTEASDEKKEKVATVKSKKAPTASSHSANNSRIATIAGKHYTLQLMGVSNEANLKRFVAANKLENVHIYHTTRQGKSIYILIYGQYQSRAQAEQAMRKLPLALQQLKPWIRNYASVQADMRHGK